MSWDLEFEDPVPLPGGRQAITLRDAADYILKLPRKVAAHEKWQTAMAVLMQAAELRGPRMHARIGMMQALLMGQPKPPTSVTKDLHWGRHRLARDR